ncbi:MAG: hypothetical protein IJ447_01690 [Clostridia bacterium]|nr:hypothetical protein [Clostridia bacterium]
MNGEIYNTVNELIKNGKLPHAILIDGGSASKRNELALYIASAFVCDRGIPCGICSDCQKAKNGSHPDIVVSDPELQNEKIFKIAAVRDIRKDAYILPNEAQHKVYILKNSDKMNIQAQNALLKIIEEPPPYARFILVCESRASLLETIMSRVTPFNLGADDYEINDEVAQKADELANRLAVALAGVTELDFMRLTAVFEKDKELLSPVLTSMQLIFRDAVAISSSSDLILSKHADTARLLASKFALRTLIELVKSTEHFFDCINKNANKNLLITRLCSVLRNTAYGA